MVEIIADPGSCHLGSLDRAKELIVAARKAGANAVKFQLFPKGMEGPNKYVPHTWIPELLAYARQQGIDLFFSVWGRRAIEAVIDAGIRKIKFAYSQRGNYSFLYNRCENFDKIYVSGDVESVRPLSGTRFGSAGYIVLYCIPLYPVPYVIDFEGLFPMFDGFSSHCLGIKQDIAAVKAGATVIEKHIKLGDAHDYKVPDGAFALSPDDFKRMVKAIRRVE